jgi:hypothetical protein
MIPGTIREIAARVHSAIMLHFATDGNRTHANQAPPEVAMLNLLSDAWPLILVFAALFVTFGLGRVLLPDDRPPYEKRPSVVTDAEHQFWRVLRDVAHEKWVILPMVRLADVIRVRDKTPRSQSWQNRIHAKQLDFVLCDPATLEAKLAVELDDATHDQPDRIADDEFLGAALAASKLPLLRVPRSDAYDPAELREAIELLI